MAQTWCILRCSSQSTLPLVRSLTRAGVEVWTPIEQVTKRVPRANIKRVIDRALLPSYLFASAQDMPNVLAIMNSPSKDHREFRLFKHNGGVPLIADETLAELRDQEKASRRAAEKDKARGLRFAEGLAVKMSRGLAQGMRGHVVKSGNEFTTVSFPGYSMPMRIANYMLLPTDTETAIMAA